VEVDAALMAVGTGRYEHWATLPGCVWLCNQSATQAFGQYTIWRDVPVLRWFGSEICFVRKAPKR